MSGSLTGIVDQRTAPTEGNMSYRSNRSELYQISDLKYLDHKVGIDDLSELCNNYEGKV